MMRRLVLVRHGESIWNAETRIQGQSCAGLSVTGHAQAAALAQALAAIYPDARLVTSDLQRSVETLAPLATSLGEVPEQEPGVLGFFDALLDDVAQAKHHVHLESFLWENGTFSERVKFALSDCARRGIEVRVLVDHRGAITTPAADPGC